MHKVVIAEKHVCRKRDYLRYIWRFKPLLLKSGHGLSPLFDPLFSSGRDDAQIRHRYDRRSCESMFRFLPEFSLL